MLSWFWEAPDWILDMSWFIGSDCCKLLRARAVDWSVGLGSRIWSDAHQNAMSAIWVPQLRPRPAIEWGNFEMVHESWLRHGELVMTEVALWMISS